MTSFFLRAVEPFKRRQRLLMASLVIGLSIVVVVLTVLLLSNSGQLPSRSQPKSYKAPITNASSRINPKELWVERFTAEQDLTTKRLDTLEELLKSLIKIANSSREGAQNAESTAPLSLNGGQSLPNPPVTDEKPLASAVREDIKTAVQNDFIGKPSGIQGNPPSNPETLPSVSSLVHKPIAKKRPHTKGIQRTSISLLNSKGHKSLKTNDNTVPAGAFAQAVLLGGVDASTSIQSSGDPRPVLLRITNPGTLPRRFKSDLKGCHALAACYGDISSERVYMRLEKLTCTERKTGEIVEMTISGYIAGEDGRAGLRGTVVDRAGASVRNAAIGGFLGGIGNFLSQPQNPVTYSLTSGLAQTNPLTNGELLKHGAAKGTSSALEKYADFYIKRAEQMQPVIQVQAGRIVDVVFTQGVAFEDSAARGALVRVNDQNRYAHLQTESEKTLKPLDAWVPTTGESE